MREVTYGAAVSLDGFLAGPDEAMDWLRFSDEAGQINAASFDGVDTMLLGRKTYEFAQRSGGGGFDNLKTYVFSRTLESAQGAELVRDDAVRFVETLKSAEGGRILVMGGGELATALIDGGLVDGITMTIHPLLLGDGARMIGALSRRVELALVEGRSIAQDCLFARYRVRRET
jgi:dihydrofolate reductase